MKTIILDHTNIGEFYSDRQLNTAYNNAVITRQLTQAAKTYENCPVCARILDFHTVVLLDVWNLDKTVYGGKKCGCTNCFKPEGIEKLKAKGFHIEVTQYIHI